MVSELTHHLSRVDRLSLVRPGCLVVLAPLVYLVLPGLLTVQRYLPNTRYIHQIPSSQQRVIRNSWNFVKIIYC